MKLGKFIALFLLCTGFFSACTFDNVESMVDPCEGIYTYTDSISAIINTNCAIPGCHQTGFGPGDFSSFGSLRVKVDGGTFEDRVLVSQDMPPGAAVLSTCEKQILRSWLDAGAPE